MLQLVLKKGPQAAADPNEVLAVRFSKDDVTIGCRLNGSTLVASKFARACAIVVEALDTGMIVPSLSVANTVTFAEAPSQFRSCRQASTLVGWTSQALM